jgi:hypothetical protein
MSCSLQRHEGFYPFPVYEFNLPAGWSCPFAKDCKIKVSRYSGKFDIIGTKFRCYAAMSERFPGVREARWKNFDAVRAGEPIIIPVDATHVRIRGSGDFFSQDYFDYWLDLCREHPSVIFWAFTKSLPFWLRRREEIPKNLTLTAGKGSVCDNLIKLFGLKYAEVFSDVRRALVSGLKIDYDDSLAMSGSESFALLDNNRYDAEFVRKFREFMREREK